MFSNKWSINYVAHSSLFYNNKPNNFTKIEKISYFKSNFHVNKNSSCVICIEFVFNSLKSETFLHQFVSHFIKKYLKLCLYEKYIVYDMINKYFDHIHVKTSFYIIITRRKKITKIILLINRFHCRNCLVFLSAFGEHVCCLHIYYFRRILFSIKEKWENYNFKERKTNAREYYDKRKINKTTLIEINFPNFFYAFVLRKIYNVQISTFLCFICKNFKKPMTKTPKCSNICNFMHVCCTIGHLD